MTTISLLDTPRTPTPQPDVAIFDPPMCCSSGLCGPTIDPTLLAVGELVQDLIAQGVRVERYQLTSHPQAFMQYPEVLQLVRSQATAALPIVVVRGRIISSGVYPTREVISAALAESRP